MNRGFLSRAGHLLGRALVAIGLGSQTDGPAPEPTPPTGAADLPTKVRLLSPASRKVRVLSPASRKVRVLG